MGKEKTNINLDEFYLQKKAINEAILAMKEQGGSAKDISDGYHTFGNLYRDRMVLTSFVAKVRKDYAWKSKQHHDGTMFDDSFIIGFDTPEGQFTYHYHLADWDVFDVKELEFAPEYDGHTSDDIERLYSII